MVRIRMTVGTVVDPHVLFAAESDESDWPGKISTLLAFRILKLHLHSVWIRFVAINQHQRPVPIGPIHCIRGDQHIPFSVFYIGGRREHVMHAGAVLHPFQINHVGREIGRSVAFDVVFFVR